jgi:formylglycine-generating enzyme
MPAASFCSGNGVRRCAEDGLSSNEETACMSDQYCDIASATCKQGVCAPHQPTCDGNRATTCNAAGNAYLAGGTTCGPNETCNAGECQPQICTPSETSCQGQDVKVCSDDGLSSSIAETCTNQTCVVERGTATCQGDCAPNQKDCSDNGVRTCDAAGQYGDPVGCTNKTCVTSGTAASCTGSCAPGQTQCADFGNIQSCGANGVWSSATACAAAKPYCYSDLCNVELPSCAGLTPSCGPSSNENCCSSPLVTGGPFFNQDDDVKYAATISDFRLDKYEVTVSRFRQFVTAVAGGWTPPVGSGKHRHLNGGAGLANSAAAGYESGWDSLWTAYLPATKAGWDKALVCTAGFNTWTPNTGSSETRPITCVSWYAAEAFCIWDGGFLPSEAEWYYAAAGGSAQRKYPWGAMEPGPNTSLAVYGCYFNGSGMCSGVTNIAPVGSAPAGNGAYTQADLMGNVAEWTLDWLGSLPATCNDCANVKAATYRQLRGDSFLTGPSASAYRVSDRPNFSSYDRGMRCARPPTP